MVNNEEIAEYFNEFIQIIGSENIGGKAELIECFYKWRFWDSLINKN